MRRNKKHRSVNHRKTTRFSAYIYIFKGSGGTGRSEIRRCFPANYRQIYCKSATPSPTRFRERKQHPRVSSRSRNASHAGKYIITHSLPCDTFCSGYKSANTPPCRVFSSAMPRLVDLFLSLPPPRLSPRRSKTWNVA